MKRFLVTLTAIALAGTPLHAAGTDPNLDYNVLQGRIASLESKIKMLETALNELSAQVAEPSPTRTSAPTAPASTAMTTPPAPPQVPVQQAPASPAPASAAPATGAQKYVIGEGDTISEISRKLGIPRSELMEANNLREGQQIYIGDQLVVPQPKKADSAIAQAEAPKAPAKTNAAPAPAPAPTAPAPAPKAAGTATTYTVKLGDTLSKIAREHGITVADLKQANDMKSDFINGGQSLKIPSKGGAKGADSDNSVAATDDVNKLLKPDESYGVYTVERGDTLYSLARDFFTSEQELQRLNKLGASNTLRPGQDLVVPTSKYEQHHKLANNG